MLVSTAKPTSPIQLTPVTVMSKRKYLELQRKKYRQRHYKQNRPFHLLRSYLLFKGALSRKWKRWKKFLAERKTQQKRRGTSTGITFPRNAPIHSFFIVMISTASAVGVLSIMVGTLLQPDLGTNESFEYSFPYRVAPVDLQLRKMTKATKIEAAGKIHFLSSYIDNRSRALNARQAKELASIIYMESARVGLDPFLVASIIQSESAFRTSARSNKSAYGLMQVQPVTAKFAAKVSNTPWKGSSLLLSNRQYNVRIGVAYLNYLLERYHGNLAQSLMAYNWGPTNLDLALQNRKRVPGSVKGYAKTILGRHTDFHLSYQDLKDQYQYMNVNFIPETMWRDLVAPS